MTRVFRMMTAALLAALIALTGLGDAVAAAKKKPSGPPLIRDAEIEGLLRLYTKPIFQAAGINPGAVKVYIINDPRINAFVAGGQRIFVHTGLLIQAKTPNEVIGVLAHETGHIAGGHLARMGIELDRASATAIIGTLAGMAAMTGAALAGQREAAKAGQGLMIGSQGFAQRNVLAYQREMEAAADQAALKYLNATGQSARGMLSLFDRLGNQSLASLENADPYVMSHPMPMDRIRNLEIAAKKSKTFGNTDRPEMLLRHQLMQAKLIGFLQPPQSVFQRYPKSDTSLPARYARAIAMFRSGDTRNALPVLDGLIEELPQDPYFWELKGQALLEGGSPQKAIEPLRQANKMLPTNGLIQILLAQALLGTEDKDNAAKALKLLREAKKSEGETPALYKFMAMAYGRLGDIAKADLSTAEYGLLQGDKELALEKARVAAASFKTGSPEWLRANDIVNFASKE